VPFLTLNRKISLQELAENNGKNGKPAYILYKGKVYDVTDSPMWSDGEHMGMHQSGKDLTEDLEMAPHRDEKFAQFKLVGELA
jgi:predicted heme/steroid binding protein